MFIQVPYLPVEEITGIQRSSSAPSVKESNNSTLRIHMNFDVQFQFRSFKRGASADTALLRIGRIGSLEETTRTNL